MKTKILTITLLLSSLLSCNKPSSRDLEYEAYCDSIFFNNREYYYKTLVPSEAFQSYLKEHGQWWEDPDIAYLELEDLYQKELIQIADSILEANNIQDTRYRKTTLKLVNLIQPN